MRIILIVLIIPRLLPDIASAQSRTFYDAGGNVAGRSATDSSGSTTVYDFGEAR